MRDERGSWYLLTGLVLGLVFGLVYSWIISPRVYGDTSPAYLRADFKDRYRSMIALAYAANGNLPRAQARLNLLGDPDIALAVASQAVRAQTDGSSLQEAQALELLAAALEDVRTPPPSTPGSTLDPDSAAVTPPPSLPTETSQGSSVSLPGTAGSETSGSPETTTPQPLLAPTATPEALFVLEETNFICDPELDRPLIQVLAQDGSGEPVSGVEVLVVWEGGEDHFFTGLKPELGPGYADFTMIPGTEYTLRLAAGGPPVSDLAAAECEGENGSRYWGSWYLVFSQP